MPEVYTFRPNPFEEEYLEKKQLSFSEFTHNSFYKAMKNDFYEKINRISNRIFVVLLGAILLSIIYIFPLGTIWILWLTAGTIMIAMGFLMLGLEVRNERKSRF